MVRMINVLCVDSDPDRLGTLVDFLRGSEDLIVRSAPSPKEALEMVRMEHFDAVISEFAMEGLNGIQLLTALREIDNDSIFILFTSEECQEAAIEADPANLSLFVCRGKDVVDRRKVLLSRLRLAISTHQEEMVHRRKAELLSSILATAPDVIFAMDGEMRITEVYRSDLDPKDTIGKSFLDFVDREFHGDITSTVGRLFATGENVNWVARGGGKFDSSVWYESNASLFKEEGRPLGVVVISRNITKRKTIEAKLVESEAKFHSLFDNALDALMLTRPDGSILMANAAACQMLGMSEEDIVEKGREGILVRDDLLLKALEERKRTGKTRADLHYRRRDGTIFIGDTSSSVFKAADGSLMTSISIKNVTERRQREETLKLANKQLNLLNQVTRHDMKNQLTIVSGYIALLEIGELTANQRDHILKVKTSLEILNRQLEFTRQYQEIGTEPPRWQSLIELVGRAVSNVDLGNIRMIGPEADLEIRADPMLEKVVYNLIENVIRHGKGATRITVSVHEGATETIVAFQDDGPGIDDQDRQHLFERGYGKHTGFGLFMSREILRMTGLEIREAGRPGDGARFEIVVPHTMARRTDAYP